MSAFDRLAREARDLCPPKALEVGTLRPELEGTLRPDQRPPPGDWLLWLLLAGRGFGKTFALANFVLACAERWPGSRGFVAAPTYADARNTCLLGESGIMSVAARPPRFVESKGLLEWPNGSQALILTAEKPERGRGPQFHWGAGDEIAVWPKLDVPGSLLSNIEIGLRLPARPGWEGYPGPRMAVATTPRRRPWLQARVKEYEAQGGSAGRVAITRGRTLDNAANLDPTALQALLAQYAGTHWQRQELEGLMLLDAEGALWSTDIIALHRRAAAPPLTYVAIGVDPSVGEGEESGDACGIVVAGVCARGELWVLGDHTLNAPPAGWAATAAGAYEASRANMVVAEVNQGGQMVEDTLRNASHQMPITKVHASQAKRARAEPISALYQQGLVHHVGPPDALLPLEQEMTGWNAWSEKSPNRIDALVWACTHLLPFVRGGQAAAERAAEAARVAAEQAGKTQQERDAEATRAALMRQSGLDGSSRRRRRY